MQANDTPSAQTGEVVRTQSNGAVQTLEPAPGVRRRAADGRQKTPPATRKPRKSTPAPDAAKRGAPALAAISPEKCISPQVPPPGALAALYRDFLREWERSRTLPQHPAYTPSFDLAALTLDAISNLDEVYNRELSWLDFNWRVLHEAIDARTPLLERLKFIAITASNLDEYFSKRVGGLKRQKAAGMANLTLDGWAPDVQLSLIARARLRHGRRRKRVPARRHPAAAAEHGIRLVNYVDLDRRRTRAPARLFSARGLPDPDAAGGRSGSSLPLYQQPDFEPGRLSGRSQHGGAPVCARQGAAVAPALGATEPADALPAAGAVDRGASGHALPRHGDRG
jgi:hypothetical protein